jgi:hypothetical protein
MFRLQDSTNLKFISSCNLILSTHDIEIPQNILLIVMQWSKLGVLLRRLPNPPEWAIIFSFEFLILIFLRIYIFLNKLQSPFACNGYMIILWEFYQTYEPYTRYLVMLIMI